MFCSVSRASKVLNVRVGVTTVLKASVCASALLTAGSANAQPLTPSSGQSENSRAIEQVVVTGTRVIREGCSSPTPVSVVSADEIAKSATPNLADYVNTLLP